MVTLIFREAWYHRARISLAVVATVAMSCMIVWLIESLDLMILRFDQDAENYLGHYRIAMIPGGETATPSGAAPRRPGVGPGIPFPASVIDELRANDLVMQVVPARQIRNIMGKMEHEQDDRAAIRRQRSLTGIPVLSPTIIGIETVESPFELEEGRWFADDRETDAPAMEGVLGTAAAASLQGWGTEESRPVNVGDTVICRVGSNDFKVKIVGLVEQKLASGRLGGEITPAVGALYVSMKTAATISPTFGPATRDNPSAIDYVYVRLREGANTKQFKETWRKHLESKGIAMRFLDVDAIQEGLDRMRRSGTDGLMGGAASLNAILVFSTLVSILIVFTTLSMGVSERARVFAMLRAIGMSRTHIVVLVFGESVLLCLLGWIGGTAAGWVVLQLSVWLQPGVYGTGKTVSLGISAVTTAFVAALAGSLLSAVIPAWRATRISPLEGMNRGYVRTFPGSRFVLLGAVGAILLVFNPVLVYCDIFCGIRSVETTGEAPLRLFLYTCIGLPTQIAGCLLLVPAMILLVEKTFTPFVAAALGLPKQLLASQLSGNFWRTLGTTLALCVGLGVYAFLEISGYSMLVPYTHSKRLPNTLVTFLPKGVPDDEIEAVRDLPGVDRNRFLPVAVDQSLFSQRQTREFLDKGLARMQASAVVFGIDIDAALGRRADGGRPLIEVDFREGTLASALEKLRTGGRYCLVPDSFAFRTGIHIGDKLELVLPAETRRSDPRKPVREEGDVQNKPVGPDGKIVAYEVCGVVSIHGWLWMNKISGVRKRGYRSGAMLLAPYAIVKDDYRLDDTAYFWFDRTCDASGRPTVSDGDLEESLQQLADRYALGRSPAPVSP
ncbi:MAG TPA: hypothetical protein DEB39_10195, partial [Planctomycetaceae bacterium]|nr:hypothetical protein [Planctomycetaceae bacterium]